MKIHGYSRQSRMNRKETKKKTSDDKVGPTYCSLFTFHNVLEERQSVNRPLCSKPSVDHVGSILSGPWVKGVAESEYHILPSDLMSYFERFIVVSYRISQSINPGLN